MGDLRAFRGEGGDPADSVATLREFLDGADGEVCGVMLAVKTKNDDGTFSSRIRVFGKMLDTDGAYLSLQIADLVMGRS